MAITVNSNHYRAMISEFLFTKIEKEGYWQHLVSTAEATLDVLGPVFEDRIIKRRVDAVWPSRNCDLTPLDYYLWDAVKDR